MYQMRIAFRLLTERMYVCMPKRDALRFGAAML